MQPSDIDKKVKGYRRLIPSMTALLEFEAVARLASFTLAAQELGVTQAAVSKQIRLLEDTLGTKLFNRLHRAIKLTHEGSEIDRTQCRERECQYLSVPGVDVSVRK